MRDSTVLFSLPSAFISEHIFENLKSATVKLPRLARINLGGAGELADIVLGIAITVLKFLYSLGGGVVLLDGGVDEDGQVVGGGVDVFLSLGDP